MAADSSLTRAGSSRDTGSVWLDVAVITAVFAVYAILPTKNYYWDGVCFSQKIEHAGPPGSPLFWGNLIHPNHLLYNWIGYLAWTSLGNLGLHVRALAVLQAIDIVLAAVCAGILRRTLQWITHSSYLSTTLALLFAFSAVFWKYATDSDAYIPTGLFLVAAFHVLCTGAKPRPLLIAALHVCAMLVHQLAVFFFPAAALGLYLKGGRRSLWQYSLPTALLTFAAYCGGFWIELRTTSPSAFLRWITNHSPDASFTFNLPRDLAITLANYPRLFFGGTGRFLQYFGPFMLITLVLFAGVLVALMVALVRHRDGLQLLCHWPELTFPLRIALVWLAAYVVFLFFWLPWNAFYKLFCLPAMIVILAEVLMRYRGPRHYRLALFVAAMALANLCVYIYPYSRPDYNQSLRFAHRMSRVWSDGAVVYYQEFTTDNCFAAYFNPNTSWKRIDPAGGVGEFAASTQLDLAAGREVWLDSTAAEVLKKSWPGVTAHFDATQEDPLPKHPIQFYRWSQASPPLQK